VLGDTSVTTPALSVRSGISSTPKALLGLLRETATRWVDDRCDRLGASLSYYAIFSLFPLLLLSITLLGFALGNGPALKTQIVDAISRATGAPAVQSLVDDTLTSMQEHRTARGVGAVVGFLALLFGASGVFAELRSSLNIIWRVRDPPNVTMWQSIVGFLRSKGLSFGLVGAAGMLMLGSLVLSTALATIDATIGLPWRPVDAAASILALTVALAAMFRSLPQTHVAWRDVFGGALLAAALLTLLKHLLAYYLAHIGSYAAYGAVGAMLGLLTVIYVSSLVVFFGAEFTRVYAERYGSLRHRDAGSPTG
jgi:membrane protein